jgi:hypothetical protein
MASGVISPSGDSLRARGEKGTSFDCRSAP